MRQPVLLGLAGALALAVLPLVANPYLLFVGNQLAIFVILAVGLNLLVGYCGQLAFSHAALSGIGAYGTALLKVHLGLPFFLALPCGALLATAVGLAISYPALRLSGLYLSLATLAFAQFTLWVFMNWEAVTFGAGGFRVPAPSYPLIGAGLGTYYLSLALAVLLALAAASLVRSRLGRAMIAVRDGEVAAEALGINLLRTKAMAFGLSAFYAGVAGGLQALMLGYMAPESFDLFHMALMKAMIVVGGLGSIAGSVIGAGAVLFLLEGLRAFKGAQEIAFGSLLIAAVVFAPRGLAGALNRLPRWRESYLRRPARDAAP
ncbi:branched-chain amino acid ABC transporter permease [Siccirubricoccus phaeus]|uniref:branched-chain amino acid ABC transporter permease n=1 Tax=Siccirubricoccus phaeus TaxID=2595053 RepID=UPI0011F2A70A|nr:branched-chain amino acid ABC transporter permease [Siccirubricoccus phaeus]